MALKPSIRSSFLKIGSKNSLLGKLLMDYTSSIAPFTSNIIVRALNVSNCSTSASIISIQSETYVLTFETVTNTVKHEEKCSLCQKPENLHVVNNSDITQLHGINLTQ